jgi:hypothetical protein
MGEIEKQDYNSETSFGVPGPGVSLGDAFVNKEISERKTPSSNT